MNVKVILLSIIIVSGMYGCATPHVVESRQMNDKNLSCQEIEEQLEEANRFEKEARAERKVTGTNVAAAVFFWPALIGTYANTEDAIEAAKERKQYLNKLYEKKGCD